MKSMQEYLSQFKPSLDRSNAKYYSEMQSLAYNLVKYLRMNEDKNETSFQGNYNHTYLKENMTEEDYLFVLNKMLRSIPMYKVKDMIRETWSSSADTVLNDERSIEDYKFLQERYDKLKSKLESIQNIIDEEE